MPWFMASTAICLAEFGSAAHGAMLLSLMAARDVVVTHALARWPLPIGPDRLLAIATGVTAIGFAVAVLPSLGTVVAGAVVMGLGDGPALAALLRIRHRDAPDGLRSQIFTTGASLKITAASGGPALGGLLVAQPLWVSLVLCAIFQAGAIWVLVGSIRRTSAVGPRTPTFRSAPDGPRPRR